jgi:membrane fusion protein (multidrug efflux system)
MAQAQTDMAARPRLVAEARHEAEAPALPALDAAAPAPAAPPKKKNSRRRIPLLVAAVAAIGLGGWYGHNWWVDGRFLVETDDAYVGADMAVIAPKVSGYVATVAVAQNAAVKKGDLLLTLDREDYRLAVEAADGRIATQRAALTRFDSQLIASDAQIAQAHAQQSSADAENARAIADFDRAQQLMKSTFGSRQAADQARADRDRGLASVESAKAGLALAEANRAVLAAQKTEAERTLAELVTARAQKQRDLDATEIRAPFDGVVGNKAVQEGDYVTPAKRLMAVAPLDRVYVDANFKETQLGDVQPGSKVRLSVDAYPEHDATGVVDSLAPASGAQFSLLPPENATGNFTKIVQRVPVRIRIDPKDVAKGLLRPGLSVIASVDTRTAPTNTSDAASERR